MILRKNLKSRAISRSLFVCFQLVSLVAEQLIGDEEITGWKIALKEIHAALNKQVSLMLVGNPLKDLSNRNVRSIRYRRT